MGGKKKETFGLLNITRNATDYDLPKRSCFLKYGKKKKKKYFMQTSSKKQTFSPPCIIKSANISGPVHNPHYTQWLKTIMTQHVPVEYGW